MFKLVKTVTRPKGLNTINLMGHKYVIFDSDGRASVYYDGAFITVEKAQHYCHDAKWIKDTQRDLWYRIVKVFTE